MTVTGSYVPDTLFYPITAGYVPGPQGADAPVLFLNAVYHAALENISKSALVLQQYFYPYVRDLSQRGFQVSAEPEITPQAYAHVFLWLPKNQIEAEYMIARALVALKKNGSLYVAADNKAGGSRLEKMLQHFGVSGLHVLSKNKARVVYGALENFDMSVIEKALAAGRAHDVLEGRYFSQPGIFGWDKIDRGSEILLQHLPDTLNGKGADFGCGYGYLCASLKYKGGVQSLACIDADWRAVEMCRKNMATAGFEKTFIWADLCDPESPPRPLDFIVMNPPFHEGKFTNAAIGVKFIQTAARVLRSSGALYMVANAHLPYEGALNASFKKVDKLFEGQGFKVFKALR